MYWPELRRRIPSANASRAAFRCVRGWLEKAPWEGMVVRTLDSLQRKNRTPRSFSTSRFARLEGCGHLLANAGGFPLCQEIAGLAGFRNHAADRYAGAGRDS